MALTLEDGTGLAGAESFASVAEATAYFGARGKADAWDAIEDKEAALRLATEYMEQHYALRWAGYKLTAAQALAWPRSGVRDPEVISGYVASNAVPVRVKRACMELALRTASGELTSDLGRETLSETVDVVSVIYAQGGSRQTKYAAVEALLEPLFSSGDSSFKVYRA